MIYQNYCDLLDAKVDAIAHVCNCKHVMGAGVARAIVNKYPIVLDVDKNFKPVLGNIGIVPINSIHHRYVFNLYAQLNYGTETRHLNYEALFVCLGKLRDLMNSLSLFHVAIPYKMGCGLAGGDWKIVGAMLDHYFIDSSKHLIICKI